MKSVDRLLAEHDLIERVLNLLEKVVARCELGGPIPANFPPWAARFFQQFADQCHHAKEEDVFFPLLKQRGIPEEGGPIGVMLHEHVLGRDCVARMRVAGQASPFDCHAFTAAAKEYMPLLRNHIFKENNFLFRMAERVMSDADDSEATARFAQVEQERGLSDQHASYSREVSDWEQTLAYLALSSSNQHYTDAPMTTYTHILNLAKETEPPADGILSRTVFQDDQVKAVLFGFGQGQELSEHTAAKPAMLFFVQGEATVGLGDESLEAQVGTWVHMPAGLKHSIRAKTPVVMLLVLLK